MNKNDKNFFLELGQRLRHIRKDKNISIAQLSAKTGICKSYLYKIENGKAYGVLLGKHIFIIACGLGIKCSFIFKMF